mmetsp:Transcript_105534/g.198720  ORF Transcript_105534/g.198720 Transcript_105534/m.198720 type:complete len:685 (-) Transcript_105534:78-2132(-)
MSVMSLTASLVCIMGIVNVEAATMQVHAGVELTSHGNPIRKVVNLLQKMQTKVTEEGEENQKMFDKFMCDCKTTSARLTTSISTAEDKIPVVSSNIKELAAKKTQLTADVSAAKSALAEASEAIAKATAIRSEEEASATKEAAELTKNIEALSKAIPAIEEGMSSSFLQTADAAVLQQLSVSMDMSTSDRDTLTSFLSQEDSNSFGGSSEIVGILKQMKEDMEKDLADLKSGEAEKTASYDSLVSSKKKEMATLQKTIEVKSARAGEAAVELVEEKNELEDTEEGLEGDQSYLKELTKKCATREKEFESYKAVQSQELLALADTIKLLNDDDALELFKKTLPSASSSFLQLQVSATNLKRQALGELQTTRHVADPRLDLIAIAMHGRKAGFDKIITMIDDLAVTLKKEQGDDDSKKAFCEKELETATEEKEEHKTTISNLGKVIDDKKHTIEDIKSEVEALSEGIKSLDADVEKETKMRKEEHAAYVTQLADNNAAKEILGLAKNRLNKFYNPNLVLTQKAPALVQLHATHSDSAPGSGVIAMIDTLVKDLTEEILEMKMEEEEMQKDYGIFMKDSAEKRAMDSKAITNKESAKAQAETELLEAAQGLKNAKTELMETEKYISSLHGQCDFLMKYYEVRKEARNDELDGLDKAKAVLSGADYSLVQTARRVRHLRGAAAARIAA